MVFQIPVPEDSNKKLVDKVREYQLSIVYFVAVSLHFIRKVTSRWKYIFNVYTLNSSWLNTRPLLIIEQSTFCSSIFPIRNNLFQVWYEHFPEFRHLPDTYGVYFPLTRYLWFNRKYYFIFVIMWKLDFIYEPIKNQYSFII